MPNLAGLIFNSVTAFVLQPDRTKRRVKRDDLDTLSEVYTGPAGGEDNFIPAIGTQHPAYSLMTLISADAKQLPGLVVQVTLNYQGKLANGGAKGYTSVPTVSKSWMEGEVTYQVNGAAGYTYQFPAGSGFTPITNVQQGIISYSRRYTGRCVQLAYITNRVPTGEPTNIGLGVGFLGFQNIWDTMTGFSAGMQLTAPGTPIEKMACTDVRVEDRADGWYRVTETYQSRMFPGMSGFQYAIPTPPGLPPAAQIHSDTAKGNNQNQGADSQASNGKNDTTQVAIASPGAAAASGGYETFGSGNGISTNVDPSIGAVTQDLTGMDPNLLQQGMSDSTQMQQGSDPFSGSSSSAGPDAFDIATPVLTWGT